MDFIVTIHIKGIKKTPIKKLPIITELLKEVKVNIGISDIVFHKGNRKSLVKTNLPIISPIGSVINVIILNIPAQRKNTPKLQFKSKASKNITIILNKAGDKRAANKPKITPIAISVGSD